MGIGAIGTKAWNYFQRGVKIAPDFVLGTGNEKFSKTLTDSFYGAVNSEGKRAGGKHFKNFWTQLKEATLEAEKNNKKLQNKNGGFWKNMWKQTTTIPSRMKAGWRHGVSKATKAGSKAKWWGGLKGSVGALGKRLPLLGGLFMIALEIPNIIGATKDNGIFGGAAETAKTATRVTSGMIGGAIGAALLTPIPVVGPIIGSIVGYMAGDGLASIITGKSHSEKKAEQEALAQGTSQSQTQQQQTAAGQQHFDTGTTNPFAQPTLTPEQLQAYYMQLYGKGMGNNDFMASTAGL